MTNDLQKHLKANKQITHVYLNEDNEWQFHPRNGFDKKLTREQVLNMKVSDEKEEVQKVMLSTAPGLLTDEAAGKAKDLKPGEPKEVSESVEEVTENNVNIETDPSQEKQAEEVQESFQKPKKKK